MVRFSFTNFEVGSDKLPIFLNKKIQNNENSFGQKIDFFSENSTDLKKYFKKIREHGKAISEFGERFFGKSTGKCPITR